MTNFDKWLTTQPEPDYVWVELDNVVRCDQCARYVSIGTLVLVRNDDDEHVWCSDECCEDWQEHHASEVQ